MPKIGLLADSHGRVETTRQAVALLADRGAQLLVHLGDVGSEQVIDTLVVDGQTTGQIGTSYLVFGNTDVDIDALARYAADLDIIVGHPVGRLDLEDRVLVYTHGHYEPAMQQALASKVDYLCHGHTHVARDIRMGQTRVINPGALSRARRYTVATLDTDAEVVTFYPVPHP